MIIGSLPRSDALRYRCHSILSLQRVMAQLHSQAASSMPADAQLQLLAVLQVSTSNCWRGCLVPCCRSTLRLSAQHVRTLLRCSCSGAAAACGSIGWSASFSCVWLVRFAKTLYRLVISVKGQGSACLLLQMSMDDMLRLPLPCMPVMRSFSFCSHSNHQICYAPLTKGASL